MKNLFTLAFVLITSVLFAQTKDFQLSSHILDIGLGQPATGVTVKLEKMHQVTKIWSYVDEKITDKSPFGYSTYRGN